MKKKKKKKSKEGKGEGDRIGEVVYLVPDSCK